MAKRNLNSEFMAHKVNLVTHVWGASNRIKGTERLYTDIEKFREVLPNTQAGEPQIAVEDSIKSPEMSEDAQKLVDQYQFFDTQIVFSFNSDSWYRPDTLQFDEKLSYRIISSYKKPFDEFFQNTAHLTYFVLNKWADIPAEIKSDLILRFTFNLLNPFYWLRYLISNIKISLVILDTLLFGGVVTTRNCKKGKNGEQLEIPQNKFTRIFWSNDAHIIRKILSCVFRPLLRGIIFAFDLISFVLYLLGKIPELLTYIPARLTLAFLYNYNPEGHALNSILALIAGFTIPAVIVAVTLLTAGVGVVGPVIAAAFTTMAAKFTAVVATVSAFLGGLTYTYLTLAGLFWITGVAASCALGIIKSTPNFLKSAVSFFVGAIEAVKNIIKLAESEGIKETATSPDASQGSKRGPGANLSPAVTPPHHSANNGAGMHIAQTDPLVLAKADDAKKIVTSTDAFQGLGHDCCSADLTTAQTYFTNKAGMPIGEPPIGTVEGNRGANSMQHRSDNGNGDWEQTKRNIKAWLDTAQSFERKTPQPPEDFSHKLARPPSVD